MRNSAKIAVSDLYINPKNALKIAMNNRAQTLLSSLELTPHPEGGYYKEVYRSAAMVHSPLAGESRNAVTDIYFLLLADQVSRFHRVLHDEIWHFYEGDPLILVDIAEQDLELREVCLGGGGQPHDKAELSSSSAHTNRMPLRYEAELSSLSARTKLMPLRYEAELSSLSARTKLMPLRYKHCVKGGNWQAAYSTGEYSLVGCTVAPGFAFSDFAFLSEDASLQKAIIGKYPNVSHLF